MRVVEILLPRTVSDRSLSPQKIRQIDAIQTRMNKYVDAIYDPKTTEKGREFLKSRLRDEYYDLKSTMGHIHAIAENDAIKYEVYDRRTGEKVAGPYATSKRARGVRDKKDLEYGAVRYGVRPVGGTPVVSEAVHRIPLTPKDFDLVKKLFERPIPAGIAPIYIQDLIEDDELTDQFNSIEENDPGRDVRPLIVEWFKRVMPDQMYHFKDNRPDLAQKNGVLSPIHGYDSHSYKGTNDPITGDAYGRF